jgi:hypothetical protein
VASFVVSVTLDELTVACADRLSTPAIESEPVAPSVIGAVPRYSMLTSRPVSLADPLSGRSIVATALPADWPRCETSIVSPAETSVIEYVILVTV